MKKPIVLSLMLTLGLMVVSSFDIPKGWIRAGSNPENYEMSIDYGAGRGGKNAATIKSKVKKSVHGYGVLMQSCLPDKYLGKRIRMTGYMRSENVDGLAFFWLRADRTRPNNEIQDDKNEPIYMGGGGPYQSVAIGMSIDDDNYEDRIKGTMGWHKYDIVIEVPKFASNLSYGAYLGGAGQIWFDGISFETVSDSVHVTENQRLREPKNLNFEQ